MKIIYQEIKPVPFGYRDLEGESVRQIILSILEADDKNLSWQQSKLVPAVILITTKNDEADEFLVSRFLFYDKDKAELIRLGIGLFDQTLLNTDFIPDYQPISAEKLDKELVHG